VDPNDKKKDDDRFTVSLAGLAFALFLIVVGVILLDRLAAQSKLEDCLLQGRLNCNRIDLPRTR
jgi:hypothetical protein